MKKIITATEARKNFYELVRAAGKPGSKITITLEGEEPVVMMSQEEWEGWLETLEVTSDPQLVKDIKAAEKENDYISLEDLKKELGLE